MAQTNTIPKKCSLVYSINIRPKNIKPFSKLKIGKGPYAKLIKDINFYTMPKSFSFRTDLDRMYNETLLSNVNLSYASLHQLNSVILLSTLLITYHQSKLKKLIS